MRLLICLQPLESGPTKNPSKCFTMDDHVCHVQAARVSVLTCGCLLHLPPFFSPCFPVSLHSTLSHKAAKAKKIIRRKKEALLQWCWKNLQITSGRQKKEEAHGSFESPGCHGKITTISTEPRQLCEAEPSGKRGFPVGIKQHFTRLLLK